MRKLRSVELPMKENFLFRGHRKCIDSVYNISMTPFNNHLIISKKCIILYHSYCCCVNSPIQPVCTFLLTLLFIKSTVYCPANFIL